MTLVVAVPLFVWSFREWRRSNLVISALDHGYGCEVRPLADAAAFGREIGVELVHDAGVAAVYRLPD